MPAKSGGGARVTAPGVPSEAYGSAEAVNSGSDTAVTPATNAFTIAFLPRDVALAASEEISSLRAVNGLAESEGPGAIASRNA